MKKSLLALAALSAFAGAASAQSSVTLFGIVDMAARSVDNDAAGTRYSLGNDGNASNRLGFRGVEDLGGGLKAGFWLEGAMSPSDGTASGFNFQRRSTVSLMGAFGELRLGRDYTPSFWNHTIFDPFGTNGVGSELNIFSSAGAGATTLVRANNTIGYFLPSLGGIYGQLQVAAGQGTTGNKYEGGRIGYAAGPINVAAAYGKTDRTGAMVDDVTEWNIGGSYNFGFMTLMGMYIDGEQGSAKNTSYTVGVTVPVGAGTFKASYGSTEFKTAASAPSASQIAVGYVYDLSKRTAVYAHISEVDNDAGLKRTASGSGPAPTTTGFKSTGYELGIRHSF